MVIPAGARKQAWVSGRDWSAGCRRVKGWAPWNLKLSRIFLFTWPRKPESPLWKEHPMTQSRHLRRSVLTQVLVALVVPYLFGCATSKTRKTTGPDLESWAHQNRLSEVTESDVMTAKASEVPWRNNHADLGSGLSLKLHRGEILGTGQLSTTSHYSLNDSKGRSLAKMPSRLSHQDMNPENSETKVWASQDHELFLVYESRSDPTGDREFHGVIYKTLNGDWAARGVVVPCWDDGYQAVRTAQQKGIPWDPVFHVGPFSVGVINGAIVLLPVNGTFFSVKPDDLKSSHPFPFSIG